MFVFNKPKKDFVLSKFNFQQVCSYYYEFIHREKSLQGTIKLITQIVPGS